MSSGWHIYRGMIPPWTLMGKPDEETTVERCSSRERKRRRIICVSSPGQQSLLRSFLILRQSWRAAELFCPGWPVVNPAALQQGAPWLRHTGTSKWDLKSIRTSTSCTMCNRRAEQWQTAAGDVHWVVGEGCVFLQPGHCVDSKSRWFTGVIQRLFTHKWKP